MNKILVVGGSIAAVVTGAIAYLMLRPDEDEISEEEEIGYVGGNLISTYGPGYELRGGGKIPLPNERFATEVINYKPDFDPYERGTVGPKPYVPESYVIPPEMRAPIYAPKLYVPPPDSYADRLRRPF